MVFSRNDIIAKNFSKVQGGYDAEEVDSFLDALADDLTRRDLEIAEEREKSARMSAQLQQMQEQIRQEASAREQSTEADAEARELIEQARLQAKMVLDRAREEAQTVVREAKEQGELIVTRKKQEAESAPRLRPLAQRIYSSFIGIDPRFASENSEKAARPEEPVKAEKAFAEQPAPVHSQAGPVPEEDQGYVTGPETARQPVFQPEASLEPQASEKMPPQQSGASLNPFIFEEPAQPVAAEEEPEAEQLSEEPPAAGEIWREEELRDPDPEKQEEGLYPQTDWLSDPEQRYESRRPWPEEPER